MSDRGRDRSCDAAVSPAVRSRTAGGDQNAKGTPCFHLAPGGTFTFEPGGQIEYSSPPCHTPSALLGLLRSVIPPLRARRPRTKGSRLLATGIDPANPIESAPLLLGGKRYGRMAEYLARLGPCGRPDDAADGVVADEPGFRRRAVAALAGAECRRALCRGDVRQLAACTRAGRQGGEAPGPVSGGSSIRPAPACHMIRGDRWTPTWSSPSMRRR